MKGKNLATDPLDRKVILVASIKELRRFAAKVELDGYLPISVLGSDPYGLAKIAKIAWAKYKLAKVADEELVEQISNSLRLGVSLALVDPYEAMRAFKFGVGHTPVDGAVYVQHPIINDAYIIPADFSRTLSKEKEAAFRQIASTLGAKKLTLINAKVQERRGFFGMRASVPDAAAEVGVKIEIDSTGALVKRVYSEYGEPRRAPWVPPDLQPWVEMDSDLRTMARDRIEGNLTKATVTLEFKEGMGVGGAVAGKLAGKGFSLGGSYREISHSIWYFDVEYYPVS